jgi:hypothetical protein
VVSYLKAPGLPEGSKRRCLVTLFHGFDRREAALLVSTARLLLAAEDPEVGRDRGHRLVANPIADVRRSEHEDSRGYTA